MKHRIATAYTHTQSQASSTWTILHGLGDYPIVDCFITISGVITKIIPGSVTYVDANTCVISFSSAQIGFATVI